MSFEWPRHKIPGIAEPISNFFRDHLGQSTKSIKNSFNDLATPFSSKPENIFPELDAAHHQWVENPGCQRARRVSDEIGQTLSDTAQDVMTYLCCGND